MARASRLGVGGGYGVDRRNDDHPVRTVQCGAYWRQGLLDVGLFDVAMAYGEDEELNWRLRQAGRQVYLCGTLAQQYRPRASLSALARQYWNYGKGGSGSWRSIRAFSLRHLVPSVRADRCRARLLCALPPCGPAVASGSPRRTAAS